MPHVADMQRDKTDRSRLGETRHIKRKAHEQLDAAVDRMAK